MLRVSIDEIVTEFRKVLGNRATVLYVDLGLDLRRRTILLEFACQRCADKQTLKFAYEFFLPELTEYNNPTEVVTHRVKEICGMFAEKL